VQLGIAFLFVKEQQFHVSYEPPLLAKLPTFHNPNKGSRVVHRMHNWMSYCYFLDIYTCYLTCKSFSRLAPPRVALRLGVFSYCGTHIKVYGHRFVGVINLGAVNKLPTAGEALDL
jgi:hypothetical protein